MSHIEILSVSDAQRRQIRVQRQNLVQICRLSVKSLIDKSLVDDISDDCEELLNFVAVMENVFMFQIKSQRAWYKTGEGHHYWDYIRTACKKLSNSCIQNIESIEKIRTKACKGRAWIMLALMEKRLSEYLSAAQANLNTTSMFYEEDAILGSDEGAMLVGLLVGLSTIDFSFCLKSCNMDVAEPLIIDFSKYIDYPERGEEIGEGDSNRDDSMIIEETSQDRPEIQSSKMLEQKYRNMSQQKEYMEEILRVRTSESHTLRKQNQTLVMSLAQRDSEGKRDREQLEKIVIELQQQLIEVKEHSRLLQLEMSSLRTRLITTSVSSEILHDKMMQQIVTADEILNPCLQPNMTHSSSQTMNPPSSETTSETFSLLPLTGSISSDNEVKATDLQMMSLPGTAMGNTVDDDASSDQSSNGTFVVVLPQHIDGAGIEGEVEVKGHTE